MDYWHVHVRGHHKRALSAHGFPDGYFHDDEEKTMGLPARISISSKTMSSVNVDLKAPEGTYPVTLTQKARRFYMEARAEIMKKSDEERKFLKDLLKQIDSLLVDLGNERRLTLGDVEANADLLRPRFNHQADKDGTTGYFQETNGTKAAMFAPDPYHREGTYCMYAAMDALERKARAYGGSVYMIMACENVVQLYSMMGIPHYESTVGWDIPTDPLVAARYFTEGRCKEGQPLEVESDAFCRMHNTFLKLEQPISHIFDEVGPPERGNAVTQNPKMRPRSTMARADACRGLMDQVLVDRQHPDPGRDDLQPILGSVYVVDKFLKDYFSYPSPARGERPLPMKTRVPRIPDQDLMQRNAMIIDVGKLMCRQSGCMHGVSVPAPTFSTT